MLYIIAALVIGFGFTFLVFDHKGFWKKEWFCCGLFLSFLLFMMIAFFAIASGLTDPKPKEFTTTYALKEFHENQYYSVSADGNVVSVWIQDGESWKKESFASGMVEFRLHTGSAEVTIEGKRYIEPSSTEKILFWRKTLNAKDMNGELLYEDEYKKVIITVPEGAENKGEVDQDRDVTLGIYCGACGKECEDGDTYCRGCGKKL